MIWFKNIYWYVGWKSLHILITKLSGLNLFICIYIVCGRHRTIKCLSNQNVRSEHYDTLSYLPVKICTCIPLCTVCADMIRHQRIPVRVKGAIIVISCALYTNVFSAVNETWGNLTALHSNLNQLVSHHVAVCLSAFMCFGGGVALQSDDAGRVGILLSKQTCYC